MIRYVLFALLTFVQVQFLSHLICGALWRRTEDPRRRRVIYCALILLTVVGVLPAMIHWSIPLVFTCAFVTGLLYEMRWYWHICRMAVFFLAVSAVELVVVGCMAMLLGVGFVEVNEILEPGTLLFQSGQNLCIFLAAFLFRLLRLVWKRQAPAENPNLSGLSLALPAGSCIIVLFLSLILPTVDEPEVVVTVLVVYMLLFLSNLFLIDLLERAGLALARRQEQEAARSELYREVDYYRQLIRRHRETSLAMRDLQNQLAAGQSLLREGKTDQALALLERMASGDRFRSAKHYTGNVAIDAVLQFKERRLREGGIDFILNVTMPEVCSVASEDLAIVVGNFMDNAIRACERIPNRKCRQIRFTVKQFQEYLCFKTENPVVDHQPEPDPEMDAFPVHGFGLQNVRRVAEKYHGNMNTLEKDGIFSAIALLHNREGRLSI